MRWLLQNTCYKHLSSRFQGKSPGWKLQTASFGEFSKHGKKQAVIIQQEFNHVQFWESQLLKYKNDRQHLFLKKNLKLKTTDHKLEQNSSSYHDLWTSNLQH